MQISNSLVTVLMSVFNSEKTVDLSIKSILSQTYANFVFLIIDDGSTGNTLETINKYKNFDKRIVVIENKTNMGIASCLNIGIDRSDTKYIARMDADDIALPHRLKKQVDFMEHHPDVGVCGSWIKGFGGVSETVYQYPVKHSEISAQLFFASALAHPTVIFRRSVLVSNALRYNETYARAQDYELWCRMAFDYGLKFHNLPEVLLHYNFSFASEKTVVYHMETVRSNLKRLGVVHNEREVEMHTSLALYPTAVIVEKYKTNEIIKWLEKLYRVNQDKKMVEQAEFAGYLQTRLLNSITDRNLKEVIPFLFGVSFVSDYPSVFMPRFLYRIKALAGR